MLDKLCAYVKYIHMCRTCVHLDAFPGVQAASSRDGFHDRIMSLIQCCLRAERSQLSSINLDFQTCLMILCGVDNETFRGFVILQFYNL